MAEREDFERRLRRLEAGVARASGASERLRRQLGEAESRGAGAELDTIIARERRNIEVFAGEVLDSHPRYSDDGIIRFTAMALVGMEGLRRRYPDDTDSNQARAIWGKCAGFQVNEVIHKISGFLADSLSDYRALFSSTGLGDDEPEPDLGPAPAPAGRGPAGGGARGPPVGGGTVPPRTEGIPAFGGGGRENFQETGSSCPFCSVPGSAHHLWAKGTPPNVEWKCMNPPCPSYGRVLSDDDIRGRGWKPPGGGAGPLGGGTKQMIKFVSDQEASVKLDGEVVGVLEEDNGFRLEVSASSGPHRWTARSKTGEVQKESVEVPTNRTVTVGIDFGGGGYRGNRILTGYVLDSITKEPVPDAKISSRGFSGTTDDDGHFEIQNLDVTTYKISVEAENYIKIEDKEVEMSRYSKSTNIELLMTPSHDEALRKIAKKYKFERPGSLESVLFHDKKEWDVGPGQMKNAEKARKEYEKYKESAKLHTGKEVPHIKIPELAKKPVVEMGRILGALSAATAGFVISAIIGIPIFTYAFLCFAAYVIIPGEPHYLQSVQKEIKNIRQKYKDEIETALKANEFEDAANISKTMEAELEAAKSLGDFQLKKIAQMPQGYAAYAVKQILKIVGAGLILIGVYTSGFPGATLAAVAGGFIAYFSFIVQRSIPEEKEKK